MNTPTMVQVDTSVARVIRMATAIRGTMLRSSADAPEIDGKLNEKEREKAREAFAKLREARMAEIIKEKGLNRVVVAACTPRTHEPLFQETLRNSGLNPYLFEMANIRNQCTWVHSTEKDKATEKSKDLVRMAIARASLLDSISDVAVGVKKSALVIGGGIAGMSAALSLAEQGFPATIVEKAPELGGAAKDVSSTWKGQDVQELLTDLIQKVEQNPDIDVSTNADVVDASGFVGNFETTVGAEGKTKAIQHGVTIIATGGQASEPDEYLYGQHPGVTQWHDLEHNPQKLQDADSIVFIQCVGSRDERRPYCSRICCTGSIMQAIGIKEKSPDTNVFILYRDIRTYGEREALYKKARQLGVIFIRYSLENKPVVTEAGDTAGSRRRGCERRHDHASQQGEHNRHRAACAHERSGLACAFSRAPRVGRSR